MRGVRRAALVAAVLAAPAAAAPVSGQAWAAAPPGGRASAAACVGGTDYNGDGCADVVIGDPAATVDGRARAGRMNVLYGGASGTSSILAQGMTGVGGTPETDDRFGGVVRAATIDDDVYADLVVAVPSESVGAAEDAGVVQVIFGSARGLGAGRSGIILRQGVFGIPGSPEAGDRFGASIAANTTDLDGAGRPAPAVAYGAPGEDVGTVADAGVAGLVTFDTAGGDVLLARDITQNSPGISGNAEAGDRFGATVEVFQGPGGFGCATTGVRGYTIVIGAPGEDLGSVRDAGMVHVARNLTTDTPLSQDSAGVDGTPESGDQFGTGLALTSSCEHDGPSHVTLAVGVPDEDVGSVADAGAVHLFRTDDDELPLPQRWSVNQNSASVEGTAEPGDRFGTTLALGGGVWLPGLGQPVVVGVPGEDLSPRGSSEPVVDAGIVHIFGADTTAPGSTDLTETQISQILTTQPGGHFGAAVGTRHDALFIGAPDDVQVSPGVVFMIEWSRVIDAEGDRRTIRPGFDGVPAGAARFGASLAL